MYNKLGATLWGKNNRYFFLSITIYFVILIIILLNFFLPLCAFGYVCIVLRVKRTADYQRIYKNNTVLSEFVRLYITSNYLHTPWGSHLGVLFNVFFFFSIFYGVPLPLFKLRCFKTPQNINIYTCIV